MYIHYRCIDTQWCIDTHYRCIDTQRCIDTPSGVSIHTSASIHTLCVSIHTGVLVWMYQYKIGWRWCIDTRHRCIDTHMCIDTHTLRVSIHVCVSIRTISVSIHKGVSIHGRMYRYTCVYRYTRLVYRYTGVMCIDTHYTCIDTQMCIDTCDQVYRYTRVYRYVL